MNPDSTSKDSAVVYLGLGSNLGSREANLESAIQRIAAFPLSAPSESPARLWSKITGVSRTYETEPWGYLEQGPFLNLVLEIETTISPPSLLAETQAAEEAIGRTPGIRYGPRTIDIDILLYGQEVIDLPGLQVPHPLMHRRAFVLAPLAELSPALLHPTLEATVAQLYDQCEGKEGVNPWSKSGA